MMNGVTSIGANNQNYQMTFRAKGEKPAYEFIDKMNETAIDFLHKDRPLKEKIEALRSKSLQWLKNLKIECPHIGKKVNPNETIIEHMNAAHYQAYLQVLKEIDPDAYKEAVIKDLNEKLATMSIWEKFKEIVKEMLNKS